MRSNVDVLELCPDERWCWCGVLMLASDMDNHGRLEMFDGTSLRDEKMPDYINVARRLWARARDHMLVIGLIHNDNGTLVVTNWDKWHGSGV